MEIDLIFKIAAIGIIVSILNQVLSKSGREEQATMTTLTGLVVVLMIVAQKISELFELVKHLFENGCEWAHVQTNFYCRVFADGKNCTKEGEYTLGNMPDIPYFSQINTQLPTFEESAKVTASVNEAFGEKLNPLQNGECLDIVRKDIDKAKGLYKLAEILSAKKEDIIAVGDNINDTHMIAEFRSYAMENAVDSIKELADFVTPSVTELIEKELEENV